MSSLNLSIPSECGVMLLSGTALFPNSSMDLNIFETRYRTMLQESLEESWMFAIGDLIAPEEEPLSECVSKVGTLALINRSQTLDDGRSALIITGLYPILFDKWAEGSIFPQAKISLLERSEIQAEKEDAIKSLLLDALPSRLEHLPSNVRSTVLENLEAIPDISALIDNVSHNFITDSDFRREMLVEVDDGKRASRLISALS